MLNVRDYGAVGDGVADDTAAIQAALDVAEANNGGWVYIPAGQYKLTAPLVVSTKTRVTAHNAYLFGQGHRLLTNFHLTDSFAGYSGRSNITVEGGTWDCRGQSAAIDDMDNALGFAHARDITVRDVTVRNVAGYHGIEVNAIDGASIEDCRLEGFRDNSATGNRGFSEAIQIDVADEGSVAIPLLDGTTARNITVRDCVMGPSPELGPFGALAGSHKIVNLYENIQVAGNRCESALNYGVRAAGWKDPIIEGNQLNSTAGPAIWVYDGWNGVVRGNTLRSPGSNGVSVANQNGVLIAGNSVISPGHRGFYLDGCYDCLVHGNHVWSGTYGGVKLNGSSDGCVVMDNMLRRGSGGASAITVDITGTVRVVHNRFDGYGTGSSVVNVLSGTADTTVGSTGSIGHNFA